jgi:uncharacterized membrane protein
MSSNIDFNALWNRGESKVPDIQEIFAKANKLNRKTRRKIWRENITLSLTAILIIWVWFHYQPQMITTKIGIVMIVLAIVAFLAANNQQFPLLVDGDVATDSRQYLTQMIRVKQKQEFLGTTMMATYFIFLSIGLALYMIEYVSRGSLTFKLLAYGITFAWMGFSWFHLAPRAIRKQRKAINEVIGRLEQVNGQLTKEE